MAGHINISQSKTFPLPILFQTPQNKPDNFSRMIGDEKKCKKSLERKKSTDAIARLDKTNTGLPWRPSLRQGRYILW